MPAAFLPASASVHASSPTRSAAISSRIRASSRERSASATAHGTGTFALANDGDVAGRAARAPGREGVRETDRLPTTQFEIDRAIDPRQGDAESSMATWRPTVP